MSPMLIVLSCRNRSNKATDGDGLVSLAYCAPLLLQPCIAHRRVGKRRQGGEAGREISSPPLVIWG